MIWEKNKQATGLLKSYYRFSFKVKLLRKIDPSQQKKDADKKPKSK